MTITGYSLSSLGDEVLGGRFSDAKYRTLVYAWVNQAQRRIAREADVRTQQTSQTYATVSGTATLSLPSDYARKIDLTNTTDQLALEEIELYDYDNAVTSTGKPQTYVVVGANVTLYPTPDAVYNLRLRYWKLPADMTSPSDVPELPADYHELLIPYALKKAYARESDFEAAAYWENQFVAGLAKLEGETQYEGQETPRQVQGGWPTASSYPRVTIP